MSFPLQSFLRNWCAVDRNDAAMSQLVLFLDDVERAIAKLEHPPDKPFVPKERVITQPDRTPGPLLLLLRDDSDERQRGAVCICTPFGSMWQTHEYASRAERDEFVTNLFALIAARQGPEPRLSGVKPTFAYRSGSIETDHRYERYQNIDTYVLWSPSLLSSWNIDSVPLITHLPTTISKIVLEAQNGHIEQLRRSGETERLNASENDEQRPQIKIE